jgi:hypothetical protein
MWSVFDPFLLGGNGAMTLRTITTTTAAAVATTTTTTTTSSFADGRQ